MICLQALILKEKQNFFVTCGIYDLVFLDRFFLLLFKANGAHLFLVCRVSTEALGCEQNKKYCLNLNLIKGGQGDLLAGSLYGLWAGGPHDGPEVTKGGHRSTFWRQEHFPPCMTQLCHKWIIITLCFCFFVPDPKSEDGAEGFADALAAREAGRGRCGLAGFHWGLVQPLPTPRLCIWGIPQNKIQEVEVLNSLKVEKYPR